MAKTLRILVATLFGILALPLLVWQIAPWGVNFPDHSVSPQIAEYKPASSSVRGQGHPDLFFEIQHAIRASEDGKNNYPMAYQLKEYRKALVNYKGGNYALNWVERGPGNVAGRTRPILVDPDDPDMSTWFVGTAGGGLWWTQSRGYSWGYLTDNIPGLAVSAIGMAETDRNIMYIGTGEGFGNLDGAGGVGVFKSKDRGQSWEHLDATANDSRFRFVNRLVIDPTDENVVVVATNDAIMRTNDGGTTWTEVYAAKGRIQDLQYQPGNFNIIIASENSTRGGETIPGAGGILRSTDGGNTWEYAITSVQIIDGSRRIELAYSTSDPSRAYASVEQRGSAGVLMSRDGGLSWNNTLVDFGQFNHLGGQGWYDNAISVHPFAPDTVFLGGIFLWRTLIEQDVIEELIEPGNLTVYNRGDSMDIGYVNGLGSHGGGAILAGTAENTPFINFPPPFTDIDLYDLRGVEVRYGQGSQIAHRFTSNDSLESDVGCFFLPYDRLVYQDTVRVPFTVWNVEDNRQLAISFLDAAQDSSFNLLPLTLLGSCKEVSNEQLFIHKYDYDASMPHDSIAQDAGNTKGMMYMILPIWNGEGDSSNPDTLNFQTSSIPVIRAEDVGIRSIDGDLDPDVDTHVDHHAILPLGIDPVGEEFWVLNTNDGGVALSTDDGLSFVEVDRAFSKFNTSQFYGADKRPGVPQYVGGTQDNGSWLSFGNPNNRRGWIEVTPIGFDGMEAVWNSGNEDFILTTAQFNIYGFTDNRGSSWDLNFTPEPGIFLTSTDFSPLAPDTLYMLGRLGVWVSPEFGRPGSWELTEISELWEPTNIGKVRASAAADSVVWAGYGLDDDPDERTLWYSTNYGETFSPAALPDFPNAPETIISGLATHPLEMGTAYALFSRYGAPKILETTDMGQTWQDISGFAESTTGASTRGFPDAVVYDLLVMPQAPHVMWAATDIGLFKSKSRGAAWNYAHNGLPAVSVYRLKYRDDEIVAATHGRGVWTVPFSEIDVSVDDDQFTELPTSFSLEQNYPNPFNPTTTISFSVPEEAVIRISVFDAIGRRVSVLTDRSYAPGSHELVWDAGAFASGVYFYRMEAGGKLLKTQKMTLVK